ncbi:murein biosynthesis integral membrane protein MurJ [Streptomyces sp. NBC_01242]|uniref:murein biosynthesis integral membrane protein MurJ n=1 Tax=unclassified Streptomyces TaxID=2593676 RepID=UPI0022502C9A|nr:murein biosynthesis integral membrane protein MurJ [Streptomyces sp. NBC_01242]MCX4793866.1 murein biosynthesis integral membrane protein MurJ [Streptomyces sp. NBC_01242]WSU20792.1 murein biosynthesis integral membrane protein MurJ [Streptomyces sp. NBC_01108]
MTATEETPAKAAGRTSGSVLRSGAVMASGSIVSRATGFVRSAVVVAALGTGLQADGYTVANTVPNILYTLLIGGGLNAVFVPELVRAARNHADGGAAYTDRLLTLCTIGLLALTAITVVGAPWIVSVYAPDYHGAQAELTIALARYCLPQILFYGLFTLLGQVLNARDRFGAMMWTPVLNNVVIIAVFGIYLAVAAGSDGTLTPAQAQWLGWGTTAGIAVQTLALVPALRAVKFRWRPRFDWRGSGLTRPLRAAGWLVMLVLTNQIAYWVVTRLSTATGQHAVEQHVPGGVGYTAYSYAYQLWVVPHGIVTVSLVTALMPRMSRAAADDDLAGVRRDVSYALRTSAAVVVPAVAVLFALAPWVIGAVYGYGRTGGADITVMAGMMMAFAPGLIAYSGQYVLSRAFYAMSDTRTPFLLNLVIAALNAGLCVAAYLLLPVRWAVTGMAGAYSVALFVGFGVTAYVLHRRISGSGAARPALLRSPGLWAQVRLVVASVPAGLLGYLAARACSGYGDFAAVGAGAVVLLLTVALLARPLRLREISAVIAAGRGRLRRA